jgi:hypothetical protein
VGLGVPGEALAGSRRARAGLFRVERAAREEPGDLRVAVQREVTGGVRHDERPEPEARGQQVHHR